MRRCPICGCNLARAAELCRILKAQRPQRWQERNRKKYNSYQRNYQRRLRARKREAVTRDVL